MQNEHIIASGIVGSRPTPRILQCIAVAAATVCEGGTATEEFTTQALTVVNERRSMLARQQQMNGNTSTNLPYGKNIRQLEWNCTLETSANGLMDGQCDHAGKTAPAGTSLIAFSDYLDSVGGTADISPILNSILMSIDHESLNVGTTTVTYTSTTGPNLANYANLARSDITSMACALETCGAGDEGRLAMYCLTDNT
ncbi:SCP-like protein [Oesophagostomum dentatum]|uniref:SCP-like protein n=1 Tax=Oesophagostomum dentatum TaxID=61180 RepID=A0A0B1T497_OESDE|nr:SCP-like protein [Oesophagostomum dentatum]